VRKALAIIAALVVGGLVAVGCSYRMEHPERSLSLPNDASSPRFVSRCDSLDDCRSPKKAEIVQPGQSFEFDIHADEERAYQVSNADGKTLGCVMVHIADGTPNPDSLSDLTPCPPGTPQTS